MSDSAIGRELLVSATTELKPHHAAGVILPYLPLTEPPSVWQEAAAAVAVVAKEDEDDVSDKGSESDEGEADKDSPSERDEDSDKQSDTEVDEMGGDDEEVRFVTASALIGDIRGVRSKVQKLRDSRIVAFDSVGIRQIRT